MRLEEAKKFQGPAWVWELRLRAARVRSVQPPDALVGKTLVQSELQLSPEPGLWLWLLLLVYYLSKSLA